jgi:hypothetical protein
MSRTFSISLGVIHVLIFASISIAEMTDPMTFGICKGSVISIEDNGVTCHGPELQFDAMVVPDFYHDLNISLLARDFSNRLQVGESALFIYWGRKDEIESPTNSTDDFQQYYTGVRITLFTWDSWVAWYYILFQTIKWLSITTGLVLLVPWRSTLPRAT